MSKGAISTNRVELAGVVEDVRGGKTRTNGYWLLLRIRVGDEDRETTFSVWWFGNERELYNGVGKGDQVEVVGELRWGRNREDNWELRVIALSFGVVDTAGRREARERRTERDERRNGRGDRWNGRDERRRKEEDEEAPF